MGCKQLLQLFEHASFQRRHQLTPSDYLTIQEWIEQAGIRWGEDWLHRNELLQRQPLRTRNGGRNRQWEHGIMDYPAYYLD